MKSIYKIWLVSALIALIVGTGGGILGFWAASQGLIGLVPLNGGQFSPVLPAPGMPAQFQPQSGQESQVVKVVRQAAPAVVSVVVTKDLPVFERVFTNPFSDNPFFRQFFGDLDFGFPELRQKGTEKRQIGAGSGFVIDQERGLIVTNRHVVADKEADYTVVLNDGTKVPARVLARDPIQDIAILEVERHDLPALSLGDSQELQIGQSVIAIGNALGEFSNTVSVGVISGLSRQVSARGPGGVERLQGVIQTDAAINPGNSGGPLLNLKGEVIGVNTAVAQGAENIGFTIPINDVKKDLEQVKKQGKITVAFLGVRYLMITPELAEKENLPRDYGALIVRGDQPGQIAVVPGSPADKAGLLENDIILEWNNQRLTAKNPLFNVITQYSPGDKVKLKVYRKGKELEIEVELGERGGS
jgi:serine protease Do